MKETDESQSDKQGIGDKFQQETKYTPEKIGRHYLDWSRMPDRYKDYDESFRKVLLPGQRIERSADIWNVISKRRSIRQYASRRIMPLNDLATLLWAIQGVTAEASQFQFRAAPSAGPLPKSAVTIPVRAAADASTRSVASIRTSSVSAIPLRSRELPPMKWRKWRKQNLPVQS